MLRIVDEKFCKQIAVVVTGKDGQPEAKLVTADCLAVRDVSIVLTTPRPQVRVTAVLTDRDGLTQAGARPFRFDDDESLKRLAPEIGALVKAAERLMLERSEIHLEMAEPAQPDAKAEPAAAPPTSPAPPGHKP